jgi:hypothetical protein
MTTETSRSKAAQNIETLDRDIQTIIHSLVRFGIEGAENPNYKIFVVGRELVLAVHLDKYPEWEQGSIEKGSVELLHPSQEHPANTVLSSRTSDVLDELDWKADPFYVLSAEFDSIIAGIRLRGFNTVAGIRLGELAEKLESIAICRDGDTTGLVRVKRKIMPPYLATLILRFEKPTEVSEIVQNEIDRILQGATQDLEKALLPRRS